MSSLFADLAARDAGAAEIVKSLFQERQKENTKLSLATLCKKAHIPSKGLLADILSGRRKVPLRHAKNLGLALGLDHLESEYLAVLVQLEQEKQASEKQKLKLQLQTIEKSLKIAFVKESGPITKFPFAFEVFCAFGLFEGKPTRSNLANFFGKTRFQEIDQALHNLERGNFIKRDGERFVMAGDQHVLFENSTAEDHLQFVKSSINDAAVRAEDHFSNKQSAFFESVVLSVRSNAYKKHLSELRQESLKWQSALETQDADMLVRYNIQIYPVGHH